MSLQRSTWIQYYAIASLLVKSSVGFVAPRATWSSHHSFSNLLLRPEPTNKIHIISGCSLQQRYGFHTSLQYSRSSSDNDSNTSNSSADSTTTSGASAVRSQRPLDDDSPELQMISFYKFAPLDNPEASRDNLFDSISKIPGLRGSIYLAQEGINAQMAVPPQHLDALLEACSSNLPFDPFETEPANIGDLVPSPTPTFNRLIVRTRDYVLRDGIDPDIALDWNDAGPELEANEWHEAIINQQEGAALLDCRNLYESDEGTFRGATPLETDTFQESWSQLDDMTKDLSKDEPVYIFCTGGIRCVKTGAYLKQHLGFDNVKRLKHGIIGYQKWAEENIVPEEEPSAWEGENFLFDKRREKEAEKEESISE